MDHQPPRGSGGGPKRWLAVLAGVVVLAIGGVVALALGGDDDPTAAPTAPGDPAPAPDPSAGASPEDPGAGGGSGGLGGGGSSDPLAVDPDAPNPLPDPDAAQVDNLGELFELVDDAELVMIDFIVAVPLPDDGSFTESELDSASDLGLSAAEELRALRDQMERVGSDGPPDAPIRAAYLEHLQAWIDYTQAVGEDPSILLAGAGEHDQAISDTADVFVESIPEELGDMSTLPSTLEALVREIIERGFTGSGGDTQPQI